jgi:excisionase family DNA binding protein
MLGELAMQNTESMILALRPREAAKALGISERLLFELTRAGKIPCIRPNGGKRAAVLYPVAELQDWLKNEARRNPARG